MDANTSEQKVVSKHHQKLGPCFTRPAYRDGRLKKAVKALKDRCKQFGSVERITKLENYPETEQFTDVFLVKLDSVHSGRRAKRTLDDCSFYGGHLHVCYAPEYETVAECRVKMHNCRRDNARVARKATHEYELRLSGKVEDTQEESTSQQTTSSLCSASCIPQAAGIQLDSTAIVQALDHIGASSSEQPLLVGSACDDARRYWLEKGATFMTSTSQPRPEANPNLPIDQPKVGKTRLVPEPVLQAMAWRPYVTPGSLIETPKSSEKYQNTLSSSSSSSITEFVPIRPHSFMPRSLRTKTHIPSAKEKHTAPPIDSHQSIDVSKTVSVGELKQLATMLGPIQGPTLPSNKVTKLKRIIFHQPPSKRPRSSFQSDSETT